MRNLRLRFQSSVWSFKVWAACAEYSPSVAADRASLSTTLWSDTRVAFGALFPKVNATWALFFMKSVLLLIISDRCEVVARKRLFPRANVAVIGPKSRLMCKHCALSFQNSPTTPRSNGNITIAEDIKL